MNKKTILVTALVLLIISIFIIFGLVISQLGSKDTKTIGTTTPTQLPVDGNNPTTVITIIAPSEQISSITPTPDNTFSNDRMALKLGPSWSRQELTDGSINFLNGDYILYINPHFLQTSGVKGGRFDEITLGSPSADLVHVFHPAVECTTPIQTTTQKYKRYDVYTNPNVDSNLCRKTASGETRWYFSYYVKESPYVTYKSSSDYSYVITVSIRVSQISDLPKKDDAILKERLAEIDTIVDSIVIK